MDEGFPIPGWDVEKHLAFMDRAGIETSVLTMPAPQPWFGDGKEAAAACRRACWHSFRCKTNPIPPKYTSLKSTPTAQPFKATSKRHTSKNTKKAPPRWCAA
ncbi:MAG: hypothetical protein IJK99_01795 [Bacteroidales bacterium]|nr:hypothetical protein [Bacteroidales bacterium]